LTHKLNKGLREHQTSKAVESQMKILRVLSYDENWHRNGEIQGKTGLSTKTLSKQLDRLEEIKLIEKDENKSGNYEYTHPIDEGRKYPYPVYYRLNPFFANAFRGHSQESPKETAKSIELELSKNGNPLEIMREISQENNIVMLGLLIFIKEHRNVDDRIKRLLLEYLVWNRYKALTWKLIEETEKIIDSIDIKKLVMDA
jgi:hypothetical protein